MLMPTVCNVQMVWHTHRISLVVVLVCVGESRVRPNRKGTIYGHYTQGVCKCALRNITSQVLICIAVVLYTTHYIQ